MNQCKCNKKPEYNYIIPGDSSSTPIARIATCCGTHQTIAGALLKSKEWKEWSEYASENMLFDVSETFELGEMSDKHFNAFVEWLKKSPHDEEKECICSGYNENGIVNQFPSINGGTASGTASLANGKSTCGLDCPAHSL